MCDLNFDYGHFVDHAPTRLPQSLFTCGTLVVLKLSNVSLAPSLGDLLETPRKLLSSCQVLDVHRTMDDNITIAVPTLQKFIYDARGASEEIDAEFLLNAPSFKCLKILDGAYECMGSTYDYSQAFSETTSSQTQRGKYHFNPYNFVGYHL